MDVPTSKVRTWFANKRARAKTGTSRAPVTLLSKRRFTPEQRALLRVHFEQDSYPTPAHIQHLAQLVDAPSPNVRAWFHNARATARRTRDAAIRAYEAANGLPPGSYALAHHVPLSSAWDAVVEDRAKSRAKRRRVEAGVAGTGGGEATATTVAAKRDTFVAAHLLPPYGFDVVSPHLEQGVQPHTVEEQSTASPPQHAGDATTSATDGCEASSRQNRAVTQHYSIAGKRVAVTFRATSPTATAVGATPSGSVVCVTVDGEAIVDTASTTARLLPGGVSRLEALWTSVVTSPPTACHNTPQAPTPPATAASDSDSGGGGESNTAHVSIVHASKDIRRRAQQRVVAAALTAPVLVKCLVFHAVQRLYCGDAPAAPLCSGGLRVDAAAVLASIAMTVRHHHGTAMTTACTTDTVRQPHARRKYRGMTDWLRRFMTLTHVSDACQPVSTLPADVQTMAMALTPHRSPAPATLRCRRAIFTFDVHGRVVQLVALRLLAALTPHAGSSVATSTPGTATSTPTPLQVAYPRQVVTTPDANAAAMLRISPGFSVHTLSPPASIPLREACSAALSVVPPADVAHSKPAMVLRRIIQACVASAERHAPGHATAEEEPFSFERGGVTLLLPPLAKQLSAAIAGALGLPMAPLDGNHDWEAPALAPVAVSMPPAGGVH